MTDREKLIELLKESGVAFPISTANFLIANGVTVQQWIPVTERLPEVGKKVLCCGPTGGLFIARTRACAGRVLIIDDKSSVQRKATNWMPIPEPPKGE